MNENIKKTKRELELEIAYTRRQLMCVSIKSMEKDIPVISNLISDLEKQVESFDANQS